MLHDLGPDPGRRAPLLLGLLLHLQQPREPRVRLAALHGRTPITISPHHTPLHSIQMLHWQNWLWIALSQHWDIWIWNVNYFLKQGWRRFLIRNAFVLLWRTSLFEFRTLVLSTFVLHFRFLLHFYFTDRFSNLVSTLFRQIGFQSTITFEYSLQILLTKWTTVSM